MFSPLSSYDDYLKTVYDEILNLINQDGYIIDEIPESLEGQNNQGEAFATSFPIQGILKYHGFAGNSDDRIAYFPSISINNDCAQTITYMKLDPSFKQDKVIINGSESKGNEKDRVILALDFIRKNSNIQSKALLISRNILNTKKNTKMGKGLGTSASGSASLALATSAIIYGSQSKFLQNSRLMSVYSRFLSGSGSRSSTGGFSMWLSHPKADVFDSFSIRLDMKKHQNFMDDIVLLTIPIQSKIKTSQAHVLAPKSPFFPAWLTQRKKLTLEFMEGLNNNSLEKIGQLAEYDTMCLHSITMTAEPDNSWLAWEPDTIKIMQRIRKLRRGGYLAYFSIDTGPSVVLLTRKKDVGDIITELSPIVSNRDIIRGKIGDAARLIDRSSQEAKILGEDIEKFNTT